MFPVVDVMQKLSHKWAKGNPSMLMGGGNDNTKTKGPCQEGSWKKWSWWNNENNGFVGEIVLDKFTNVTNFKKSNIN